MSAAKPPTPGGDHDWPVEHASRNGASVQRMSESERRLVVVAYITAIAMPAIGFVLGIVVTARPKPASRHAVWIIVLSVIATGIWILVFTSGVLSPSNTETSY
jgi:hypothetical protein